MGRYIQIKKLLNLTIKIENHSNYASSNQTLPSLEPYTRELQTIIPKALEYSHSWGCSHKVDSDQFYSFALSKVSWLCCSMCVFIS